MPERQRQIVGGRFVAAPHAVAIATVAVLAIVTVFISVALVRILIVVRILTAPAAARPTASPLLRAISASAALLL
jgi:hypothetical protein